MVDYAKKKNDELKGLCKERGLRRSSKKADLVKRLEDYDAEQSTITPAPAASDYAKKTRNELCDLCDARGLSIGGKKAYLVKVLENYDAERVVDVQPTPEVVAQKKRGDTASVADSLLFQKLPPEI